MNKLAATAAILELHDSADLGEKGIVAAASHVQTRTHARAALTNQNRPAGDVLSIKPLDTQPLGLAVATVP